ncbi:methyltransferase domain-containing protein [Frankia sp. AgPm24]|uniref:class I SAM-dependent methyltransferase n=1 Tax=Frankia sp. AgPm24 TaxID=631128 RepID=UPI00200FF8C8|nr:class I SAM-dependent methyltransferase [Frankia sp. AgPm24]MCK9924182.1 methyltransferase domain-containing protein [Frankia sp. AgPm24]
MNEAVADGDTVAGHAGHESHAGHDGHDHGGQGGSSGRHWIHDVDPATDPTELWERFYSEGQPWSGRANPALVDELAERPIGGSGGSGASGTALDLGCGTGGDAIWLAGQGWQVDAVDISPTALARGAAAARALGLDGRIRWSAHNLDTDFPTGAWDLVTTAYLHSPVALDRERILRRAATAVAVGGTLIIIGHLGAPSWMTEPPPHFDPPSPEETVASLDLTGWTVVAARAVVVPSVPSPEGVPGTRTDSVVRLRRTG